MERTLDYSPLDDTLGKRLVTVANVIAWGYPFVLPGAFYAAWLLAWMKLGHAPRLWWDDPAETLGVIYWASALPILLLPIAGAATICSVLSRLASPRHRFAAVTSAVLIAGLWVGAIKFLQWDPIDVINWWMD